MKCAYVVDGVVTNIIKMHPMNALSMANAIPTNGLPVSIGDTYVDGVFYRDGTPITMPDGSNEEYEDMQNALSMLEVRLNG